MMDLKYIFCRGTGFGERNMTLETSPSRSKGRLEMDKISKVQAVKRNKGTSRTVPTGDKDNVATCTERGTRESMRMQPINHMQCQTKRAVLAHTVTCHDGMSRLQ